MLSPLSAPVLCRVPTSNPATAHREARARQRRERKKRTRLTRLSSSSGGGGRGGVGAGAAAEEDEEREPPAYVDLTLRLGEGDDAEAVVRQICAVESLPESFEHLLSSSLHLLFRAEEGSEHGRLAAPRAVDRLLEARPYRGLKGITPDDPLLMVGDAAGAGDSDEDDAEPLPLPGAPEGPWDPAARGALLTRAAARDLDAKGGRMPPASRTARVWAEMFRAESEFPPESELSSAGRARAASAVAAAATAAEDGADGGASDAGASDAGGGGSDAGRRAADGAEAEEDAPFPDAFSACLAAGGEYAKNVFHIERSDALAVGRAFKKMTEALAALQQQQSREMDKVLLDLDQSGAGAFGGGDEKDDDGDAQAAAPSSVGGGGGGVGDDDDGEAPQTVFQQQSNTDRISQLVNRHVQDTKTVEEKWTENINRLKRRQRTNYRQFIVGLYRSEVASLIPLASLVPAGAASRLASAGANPALFSPPRLEAAEAAGADSPGGVPPLPGGADLGRREIYLGRGQLKSGYVVRLAAGDVLDLCVRDFTEREMPAARRAALSLYSDALTAVVLPHRSANISDIGGVGASPRVKRFVRACDSSTEYHFRDLRSQMRSVKILSAQNRGRHGKDTFAPGDFFVTRHSNLLSAHLAFHLMDTAVAEGVSVGGGGGAGAGGFNAAPPEPTGAFETGKDAALDGLRQILLLCSRSGVHSVAVPVLFSESHSLAGSASASAKPVDETTMRQAEATLRCVRACLAEVAPDSDSTLKEVVLFVPTPPPPPGGKRPETPLVRHCAGVFNNVFH